MHACALMLHAHIYAFVAQANLKALVLALHVDTILLRYMLGRLLTKRLHHLYLPKLHDEQYARKAQLALATKQKP